MKTRKELKKYFSKRVKSVNRFINKPDDFYSADDYHRLRVEIKKIRALVKLLQSGVKNFKPNKMISPIEKIFQSAGKVREIQLENAMLHKHDPKHRLKVYSHSLKTSEEKAKKDFSLAHDECRSDLEKSFGGIASAIKKINKNRVDEYVQKRKRAIASISGQRTLKTKQVHELRKGLKKLYYNLRSLDLKNKSTPFKNGEALQELMGKWHDNRVMKRHLLKVANKRMAPPSESERLAQIADQLNAKSHRQYRLINTEKQKRIF